MSHLMEGKRMSLYGKSSPCPGEKAGLWKNVLQRTERIRNNHLSVVGDGTRHFPGVRRWTEDELIRGKDTFCGARRRPTVADVSANYDRLFHLRYDYDCKIHRDDRRQVLQIGRAVHDEERMRKVPVLSSSQYGRRAHEPLEPFDRKKVVIEHILKGFYYKRGTGLPPLTQSDAEQRDCL